MGDNYHLHSWLLQQRVGGKRRWQSCHKVRGLLPNGRLSAKSKGNPNWPPRSPHEALLSTPGGRDRLRRMAERASPSPSPSKRPASASIFRNRAKANLSMDQDEDEDDDDEETLQLQLQEIQARLKLKKLQKKAKHGSDSENDGKNSGLKSLGLGRAHSVATSRGQSRMAARRDELLDRPTSQNTIHVPVSPVRRAQPAEVQRSPGRVLLGIDKGLKGSDISLKRAPSLRKREELLQGPYLQRPNSQAEQAGNRATASSLGSRDEERPQTFSERMAAVRSQEADREQRDSRIKKKRSAAFDIDQDQMHDFKQKAVEIPNAPRPNREFSREEILNSYNKPAGMTRSKTVPDLRSGVRNTSTSINASTIVASERSESQASSRRPPREEPVAPQGPPSEVSESEATQFEPYSSVHLSKRIIPHQVLTRTLSGKKTFLLPDLLRVVKSPDFSLPEIEEDIVIFAIIAQKSEPRAHAANGKAQTRGKYMIMSLTDLKWEVDLFLFDSGFEKFWKMTPGTIIAILNPGIMPPSRGKTDTGKFSLTVNSEADTILEVGSARDLGFCKSLKKEGKTCDSWVDKRHTEFCDYHVNETLKKTHSKRMEVNTMNFGKGGFGARGPNSHDVAGHMGYKKKAQDEKRTRWDRESHSQIFIGSGNASAAKLLDNVDYNADAFHRGSTKEERVTRQILAKEKERELAKRLGAMGGGLGADYMRRKDTTAKQRTESSRDAGYELPPPPDAAALGLLSGKAKDVDLGPIKRKRTNTSSLSSAPAAMGWGTGLTKKLGSMKEGENLQPVKKKTRFVTEKGIREAGRESFGGDLPKVAAVEDFDDDDDDDLDIVRE